MIKLILQPPSSSLCGQACVAMAAGITLEESIRVFGHKHKTKTKELIRVLRSRHIFTGDKLKRFPQYTAWSFSLNPHRAIIKEIYGPIRKRKSHWILLWDGHIYDPDPHDIPGTKYSSYLGMDKITEVPT